MTEFSEIVKQARRMCEYYSHDRRCAVCPLSSEKSSTKSSLCMTITEIDEQDAIEIERIVTEWAKEHPEPTYPSWVVGWKSLFPNASCIPCQNFFGEVCQEGIDCAECRKKPMSKYVAEKLGIKPITTAKVVPEHDGCYECRWEDKNIDEEPCKNCCIVMGGPAPDLWEKR